MMNSFGGLQSGGGLNYTGIDYVDGSVSIVKQEPAGSGVTSSSAGSGANAGNSTYQQTNFMMDALSSNPMLTTASMPIPSRNANHQRAMQSELDFATEMDQFRSGQLLHDITTIATAGGAMNNVGGFQTGSLPTQIDGIFAIPSGWDNMILSTDGIDLGPMNVAGLPMMDTWHNLMSPASTGVPLATKFEDGLIQQQGMEGDGVAMGSGIGNGHGQQMMEEFEVYPLEDFSDGLLCHDLNTIEGLFHDDITLLSQPNDQQSPNLSGDSAIILSPSLPQQILGRPSAGLILAGENTVGSVGSNSLSSGFGPATGGMQLLTSDPMVAATYINTNSNSSSLLYDEQTRISSSPFELYTKQEPGSAVPSPLAFSPSSHGSSPSISDGGHLMVPQPGGSGPKHQLQQQLQSSFGNNNALYGGGASTISAGKLIKTTTGATSPGSVNNNNIESAKNQNISAGLLDGNQQQPSQQMPVRASRRGFNFSRNSGNVGQVQHNPKYSTLQQLLMSNTSDRLGSGSNLVLGQSVPAGSGSSGLLSGAALSPGGGSYSGRRLLQQHAQQSVSVGSNAGTSGTSMSRLSSSAPTHISGFEQIWQRREPRPHLLSTGSLAEAGSTSSLSTGSVLSPEAPDYSHDEGYSDDSDHSEDYSSGDDSDIEGKVSTSAGSSKAKRFFWQYNVQAKGPKGQRLVIKTQAEDPHVLNAVTDPVFSPHCSVRGIKNLRLQHSGKARKGDGNDLTPNPRKLHNIGKELDKLGRVINDMKPVSELPFNARPKTRKEKNKLASRACRLKKKAQHEANKIKLYGLETEHKRLMNGIFHMKQILVTKAGTAGTSENPEEYKQQLDALVQTSSKIKIAGNSTEFVNKMLENVRAGNNISIDTVLEQF